MTHDRRDRADALADEAARLFEAVEAVAGLGAEQRLARSAGRARPPRPVRQRPTSGTPDSAGSADGSATTDPWPTRKASPSAEAPPTRSRSAASPPRPEPPKPEPADPTPSDDGTQAQPGEAPAGAHPSTCTWCPVCRGVDSLRAVDPDTVARLADAVTMLADALGELAGNLRERLPVPRADDVGAERREGKGAAAGERTAYGSTGEPSARAARDGLDAAWRRGGNGGRGSAYDIAVQGEEEEN